MKSCFFIFPKRILSTSFNVPKKQNTKEKSSRSEEAPTLNDETITSIPVINIHKVVFNILRLTADFDNAKGSIIICNIKEIQKYSIIITSYIYLVHLVPNTYQTIGLVAYQV